MNLLKDFLIYLAKFKWLFISMGIIFIILIAISFFTEVGLFSYVVF